MSLTHDISGGSCWPGSTRLSRSSLVLGSSSRIFFPMGSLAPWTCGLTNNDERAAPDSRASTRFHFGRRRNVFFHARRRAVLPHLFEPDAVDARVLILVFDLIAAVLDAFRHRRRVAFAGAEERNALRLHGRIAQAPDRAGEIARRRRPGIEMLMKLPVGRHQHHAVFPVDAAEIFFVLVP